MSRTRRSRSREAAMRRGMVSDCVRARVRVRARARVRARVGVRVRARARARARAGGVRRAPYGPARPLVARAAA